MTTMVFWRSGIIEASISLPAKGNRERVHAQGENDETEDI